MVQAARLTRKAQARCLTCSAPHYGQLPEPAFTSAGCLGSGLRGSFSNTARAWTSLLLDKLKEKNTLLGNPTVATLSAWLTVRPQQGISLGRCLDCAAHRLAVAACRCTWLLGSAAAWVVHAVQWIQLMLAACKFVSNLQ